MPATVARAGFAVRKAWEDAIEATAHAYRLACLADVPYQDARFVLPEGTTTFIMLEYPLREFFAVYNYRACTMFQWEIREVIRECGRLLSERYPWLEPYIKISCEKTHVCEFQGWERVEGFCKFPWAREDNRRFRSERHEIKPGTGVECTQTRENL